MAIFAEERDFPSPGLKLVNRKDDDALFLFRYKIFVRKSRYISDSRVGE